VALKQRQAPTQSMMGGEQDMEAMREMMRAMQENPDDPDVNLQLAGRFLEMGAYEQAATFAQNVLNVRPGDARAMNLYAVALFQQGSHQASAEAFQQLLDMGGENVMAHYNLGVLYKYYLDQPERAVGHFQRAMEMNPEERVKQMLRKELSGEDG
jgi:tetratricopeptide (TPR) repeat protein